jgi:CheY-like chemotaxis protein
MPLARLKQHMERTFRQMADEKELAFKVEFDPELPESIRTDEKRLQQVVLNLLSNAFKFTAQGGVTLSVRPATGGWSPGHPGLRDVDKAIEIAVSDTGIGISSDKQRLIFEPFTQADGTTSRKYGGTGLGLSISREIAGLLGGELKVHSEPNVGSTFTLYVPFQSIGRSLALPIAVPAGSGSAAFSPVISDDRDDLNGEPFVLIVEDDQAFAGVLLELARSAGLKGVISAAGSGTIAMVRKLQPTAVTLDLGLSDIDGFVLLELLRHDPDTAHIPVHVISGAEQAAHALTIGASGVIRKPADDAELLSLFQGMRNPAKSRRAQSPGKRKLVEARSNTARDIAGSRVLIVDDDIRNIYSLTSVLEAQGVVVNYAERGAEGIRILEANPDIDVALIDIMMPDMDGYETMRQIRMTPDIGGIPLVAVTAKAMKGDRQKCLDAGASDYISKPVDIDLLLALLRVWIGRGRSERNRVEPAKIEAA